MLSFPLEQNNHRFPAMPISSTPSLPKNKPPPPPPPPQSNISPDKTAAAPPYTRASQNPQTSSAPHTHHAHAHDRARAGRPAGRCIPFGRRNRIRDSVRWGGRGTSGLVLVNGGWGGGEMGGGGIGVLYWGGTHAEPEGYMGVGGIAGAAGELFVAG